MKKRILLTIHESAKSSPPIVGAPVFIETVGDKLSMSRDELMPYLDELKNEGYIKYYDMTPIAVKLTELGARTFK